MKFVPRREKVRKGFTSPDGIALLAKIGPEKTRGGDYFKDSRRNLKPHVRKLRDGSIVSGDNGNPYPYTTSASKEQGRW